MNPLVVRHHENPAYQGLRVIPGVYQRYPIIECFYAHSLGVGTRDRGAAAVCQVTTNRTYAAPTLNF